MMVIYILAGVGALTVFALLMWLADELDKAIRQQVARWRIYRCALVVDLAALRAWARMTRAHLRGVRQLVRRMKTDGQTGGGDGHA